MKKIVILLIALLLISGYNLMAVGDESGSGSTVGDDFKKVGAAGGQFLKIGVGARATGMAGAFTGVADDLTSLFWNPAGISDISGMTAHFSYTAYWAEMNHQFAGVSMPIGGDFVLAASMTAYGTGDIEITTLEQDQGTGVHYSVNDITAGLSFGGYLTDQFAFGITGKFVQNSFASLNASGVAFDIGTKYHTGIQGITLGFAIMNLGSEQEYSGQDLKTSRKIVDELEASGLDATYLAYPFSLPIIFRAGVASDIYEDEDNKLTGALDFVTLSDTPEQFALGAEYSWKDFVTVRGGYRIGQDQLGVAGGVGLKYFGDGFGGVIDYSINPTADLGLINRFTIVLNFD